MNRLFFTMGIVLFLIVPQAWGSTSSHYPNAYRQTMWNSLTDGIHTLGQNPKQAAHTKMKLHQARTKARIGSINRAKRQAWLNSHN